MQIAADSQKKRWELSSEKAGARWVRSPRRTSEMMKGRHGRAACNLLDWCHGTWFWGFKGLKFQTIKMSLLFRGHRRAKHKRGLKLTSCIFLITDLKRTFIPARSSDQSPGGSVGRTPLHRIMGFPSVPGLQMLHQNGRTLMRRGTMVPHVVCIVFSRFCFGKYEPKITEHPAAAYVWKDQQSLRDEVSSFFLSTCWFAPQPQLLKPPKGKRREVTARPLNVILCLFGFELY